MKLTKKQKAEQEELVKKLSELVRSFGPLPSSWFDRTDADMSLATKFGILHVTISPNVANPGASVFMRFEDPKCAHEGLCETFPNGCVGNCNPYSGKWNDHFFDETAAVALGEVRRKLQRVCLKVTIEELDPRKPIG